MSAPAESRNGVWSTLKRAGDTLLATAQNRVELFSVELREEKYRLIEAIICAGALVAFGTVALTMVTITIVVLFWDNARVPALIFLSVLYSLAATVAWRSLRSRLNGPKVFAGTLGELEKDRACLRTDH